MSQTCENRTTTTKAMPKPKLRFVVAKKCLPLKKRTHPGLINGAKPKPKSADEPNYQRNEVWSATKPGTFQVELAQYANLKRILGGADDAPPTWMDGSDALTPQSYTQQLNTKIVKHFECMVCKCYMHPRIYQCDNGHCCCVRCTPRVIQCPVCRADFDKPLRAFHMERLHSLLVFPCRNTGRGCTWKGLGKEFFGHSVNCEFKPPQRANQGIYDFSTDLSRLNLYPGPR